MQKKRTLIIARIIVFTLLFFNFQLLTFNLLAQSGGVAINSTGGTADNSAMLDVSSINQGMRIPRVALTSTTSAAPITNPVNSLLVYDSVTSGDVTPGFYYWDGTTSKWIRFSTGSGGSWSTSGNAGTDTATNFIGTTDDKSWVMKTNSTERMKISKSGNVGIGTSNPASSAILDVSSTTKGLRMPNMTTNQRDAISLPSTGLQIYNTDCGVVNYYNGNCWISMSKSLPDPGTITTDTTSFCSRSTHTYSIAPIPTATSYTWSVPAGSKIMSGIGTTSISVIFGSVSGSVCVKANNSCETSLLTCIDVNVSSSPLTPGNITGPITAVPGQTAPVSYSIASIPSAITYNWTVPPGASITSGTGTTNIVVNYSCNTTAGYVAVSQTAACGTSTPASLAIAVNPLSVTAGAAKSGPGTLGGSPTASGGYGTYVYAWSPAAGLSGTTIANPTANACTTTTYTLTVTDINTCSATSSVVVTKNLTVSAGSNINIYSGYTLIGPAVGSGGAGSYTYSWSPTSGMTGSTTTSPTVINIASYTVTITDANNCTATSSMNLTSAPGSPVLATYSGSLISWTVPSGITSITIEAWGAQGGTSGSYTGGLGARMKGTFTVSSGQILKIIVGQQGNANGGYTGGGGGTFVTDISNNPLIIAGGGGGADSPNSLNGQAGVTANGGTNSSCCSGGTGGAGGSATNAGAGGGGLTGNGANSSCSGTTGGKSFTNGGAGGPGSTTNGGLGGFGGGGGGDGNCNGGGGGGGGYSGGGGGHNSGAGAGGGGSYNNGTSQSNTSGEQSGNGKVIITY
ncbi:MAG: hypothetical protein HGB12_04790 [Bacteroidetes bacterium]|nr:hypothetical protein [Bacteroidota bacterium]